MNKIAIAFFAVIAVASAASLSADGQAQVLRSDATVNENSFQYAYETSNGIAAQESGQLKQIGNEAAIVSQGSYSYTGPDGQQYTVTFIADENGFQPQGAHLPVAPEAAPALRVAPAPVKFVTAAPQVVSFLPAAPQPFRFQPVFRG